MSSLQQKLGWRVLFSGLFGGGDAKFKAVVVLLFDNGGVRDSKVARCFTPIEGVSAAALPPSFPHLLPS